MMICILVRDFAIKQEKCLNSSLSSASLILVHAGKYRPTVIAMDIVARETGVIIGMSINQAQTMCPPANILHVDESRYRRIFNDITLNLLDITDRIEPEYQPTSAVWYTDDTLMLPYLLESIHQQTGIIPQIGNAHPKFPARVAAAMTKQGEQTSIPIGYESKFLAQYPTTLLPLDKSMQRRLPLLGIDTLEQFAKLPRLAVFEQFGKHGRWLHDLANGKDIRPLSPFKPPLNLQDCRQFEDAVSDRRILTQTLEDMSLKLVPLLNGQEAKAVTLMLHMEDKTLLEHHREPHQTVRDGLYLLRLLTQMLDVLPVYCSIVEVEVRLDKIVQRKPVQLSLFDQKTPVKKLSTVIPNWASRYPNAEFYRLSVTGDNHLPERVIERQKVVGA